MGIASPPGPEVEFIAARNHSPWMRSRPHREMPVHRTERTGASIPESLLGEPQQRLQLWSLREMSTDDDQSRGCRSEEHTSELQSRENIVCRLLLDKKN